MLSSCGWTPPTAAPRLCWHHSAPPPASPPTGCRPRRAPGLPVYRPASTPPHTSGHIAFHFFKENGSWRFQLTARCSDEDEGYDTRPDGACSVPKLNGQRRSGCHFNPLVRGAWSNDLVAAAVAATGGEGGEVNTFPNYRREDWKTLPRTFAISDRQNLRA